MPEDRIRERFARNPTLIRDAVLLADRAFVYDNSTLGTPPALKLEFVQGQLVRTAIDIPDWVRTLYANELDTYRMNPNRSPNLVVKAGKKTKVKPKLQ